MTPEPCRLACRVWAQPPDGWPARRARQPRRKRRRDLDEYLIFVCETTSDRAQRPVLVAWRVVIDGAVIEEAVAYPDARADEDRVWLAGLRQDCAATSSAVEIGDRRLRVESLSWWLKARLLRYGFRRGAPIIGPDLPGDLGGFAQHWGPAYRSYAGGVSLGLWGYFDDQHIWHDWPDSPRVKIRQLSAHACLIGFGQVDPRHAERDPSGRAWEGRFVNLPTLVYALTAQDHDLGGACAAFEVEPPRIVDGLPQELGRCLGRLAAADRLYRACRAEVAALGIGVDPDGLFSPATSAEALLENLSVASPLPHFGLPAEVLGASMVASYGGRSEARIVGTEVPVVCLDWSSMHPTANVLLGIWDLWTAERIEIVDVTERIRELCGSPDLLDALRDLAIYRELGVTLVFLRPDGDRLIHRAYYDPRHPDPTLALNPLTYDGVLCWPWPDVVGAGLLGTEPPSTIVRAIKLVPVGHQAGLRSVTLPSGRVLNPLQDDPFRMLVEERHRAERDPNLTETARARRAGFYKGVANSLAYGLAARVDTQTLTSPQRMAVFGPAPSGVTSTRDVERPGRYCFPPVAATVTSFARLMLAIFEVHVQARGGAFMSCDTDAAAFVAIPGGGLVACIGGTQKLPDGSDAIRALSHGDVDEIRAWFEPLNPYDRTLVPGSPWHVEHDSLNRQVRGFARSAKRYQLSAGASAVKVSELGLGGTYLDPTGPGRPPTPEGRLAWVEALAPNLASPQLALPEWASRLAVSPVRVATWDEYQNLGPDTARLPEAQRIRPFSRGLLAHVHPASYRRSRALLATYTDQPDAWPTLDWRDDQGDTVPVIPGAGIEPSGRIIDPHAIPVVTIADVIERYRLSAEPKSLPPDQERWQPYTRGLLRLRPIRSTPGDLELIGKEGRHVFERATGLLTHPDQWRTRYPSCCHCGEPLTGRQRDWCSDRCRKAAGRHNADTVTQCEDCGAELVGTARPYCARCQERAA